MPKKTIDAVDVAGKRVLIRVDYNVPLDDSGKITDDRRIRASVPTIRSVISRGGRAILVSHMGRPKGEGIEAKYSLAVCAQKLSEILGEPVGFPSQDCTDAAAAIAVNRLGDGQVVLLENLRFHATEKNGDHAFAQGGGVRERDGTTRSARPTARMRRWLLFRNRLLASHVLRGFCLRRRRGFCLRRLRIRSVRSLWCWVVRRCLTRSLRSSIFCRGLMMC